MIAESRFFTNGQYNSRAYGNSYVTVSNDSPQLPEGYQGFTWNKNANFSKLGFDLDSRYFSHQKRYAPGSSSLAELADGETLYYTPGLVGAGSTNVITGIDVGSPTFSVMDVSSHAFNLIASITLMASRTIPTIPLWFVYFLGQKADEYSTTYA